MGKENERAEGCTKMNGRFLSGITTTSFRFRLSKTHWLKPDMGCSPHESKTIFQNAPKIQFFICNQQKILRVLLYCRDCALHLKLISFQHANQTFFVLHGPLAITGYAAP